MVYVDLLYLFGIRRDRVRQEIALSNSLSHAKVTTTTVQNWPKRVTSLWYMIFIAFVQSKYSRENSLFDTRKVSRSLALEL